jgi:uncharacterized membrane-anchored protein YjiN (DUF445 family)
MFTIQLTAGALNDLIDRNGGDEFVLKLRQGVMENVFKTRIKAMANETLIAANTAVIQSEIKAQIGEVVKDRNGWTKEIKVDPVLLEAIQKDSKTAVDKACREMRLQIAETATKAAEEFAATFDNKLEQMVTQKIEAWTKAHVDKLVETKLKAALGL